MQILPWHISSFSLLVVILLRSAILLQTIRTLSEYAVSERLIRAHKISVGRCNVRRLVMQATNYNTMSDVNVLGGLG